MVDNTFRAYTRLCHISFNHLFNFQIKFGSPTHISICFNAAVYYNDTVLKYVIFCFNFIVLSVPSVYSRYTFHMKNARTHNFTATKRALSSVLSFKLQWIVMLTSNISICLQYIRETNNHYCTYISVEVCLIQLKMEEPYHLVIGYY